MRAQVETFLAQHPGYVPRGWKDRLLEPVRAPMPTVASKEMSRSPAGPAVLFGMLLILLTQYFTGMWSCMELNTGLSSWPVACLEEGEIIDAAYVLPAEKLYNSRTMEELRDRLGVQAGFVARRCSAGDRGLIKARGSLGSFGANEFGALEEMCREACVEASDILALELYDDRGLVVVGEKGISVCSRALVDTRFAAVVSALFVSYFLSRFCQLNLDFLWALGLSFAVFIGFEGARLVKFGGVWPIDQTIDGTCSEHGGILRLFFRPAVSALAFP